MNLQKQKKQITLRRKKRIRAKMFGTLSRPRLSVFRSLKHISAQLIDDENSKTLVSATEKELKEKGKKSERAKLVGGLLGQKALAKEIKQAVFDKGSYRYHGRIKALADGAREAGLKI
ncbi:MAG: 50S ribosomal protein L18 [Patescibacteria group bacterium]